MRQEERFQVEYCRSDVSTCRVCMARMPKGALRIGLQLVDAGAMEVDAKAPDASPAEPQGPDKRKAAMLQAPRWHHFECFPRMKRKRWMSQHLPKDPKDIDGFDKVKKSDQRRIIKMWKQLLSDDTDGAVDKGKRKGDQGASPSGKRAKTGELPSEQGVLSTRDYKKILRFQDELANSDTLELRRELEHNNQLKSGKRDDLIRRVAEGRALGGLPQCPRCQRQLLHFDRIGGWYSCPGYYERFGEPKRCNFQTKDAKRKKWKRL